MAADNCDHKTPSGGNQWSDAWAFLLAGFIAVLPLFHILYEPWRRRSANRLLRLTFWVVIAIEGNVSSYVLGTLPDDVVYYDRKGHLFYPLYFWAVHLMMLETCGITSSYSLSDNQGRWQSELARYLLTSAGAVFSSWPQDAAEMKGRVVVALLALVLLSGLRMWQTISAHRQSPWLDFGLSTTAKRVGTDHMQMQYYGHERIADDSGAGDSSCEDPIDLRGYHYLVLEGDKQSLDVERRGYVWWPDGELSEEVVTVDMVWRCSGRLLNDNRGGGHQQEQQCQRRRLKDMCLSFALCKLLTRQLGGFVCTEQHIEKTREFVFSRLLGPSLQREGVERAFAVVEMELAFLYDSLYTTYPVFFAHGWRSPLRHILSSIAVIACYAVLAATLVTVHCAPDSDEVSWHTAIRHCHIQSWLSLVAAWIFILTSVLELLAYLVSDWGKVLLLCSYVRKPNWQSSKLVETLVGFMCRLPSRRRPWQNKIGQYSLFYPRRCGRCCDPCRRTWLLNAVHRTVLSCRSKGRRSRVQLHAEIKEEVFRTLKRIASNDAGGCNLTNGKSVLNIEGLPCVELLAWAFDFERATRTTHTILVWHIATTLCDLHPAAATVGALSQRGGVLRSVACCLSKYCVYLTACVPTLIPDPRSTIEVLVKEALLEADELIPAGCDSMEAMYEKLMGLDVSAARSTIVVTGVKLGRILVREVEDELRWRILSDFWTEMLLWVAHHDKGIAHAECLTKGGEFISHLWVLLSHAGMIG